MTQDAKTSRVARRLALVLALAGCDDGPLGRVCEQVACVDPGVTILLTSASELPLGQYTFELTTDLRVYEWPCVIDATGRCAIVELENEESETLFELVTLEPIVEGDPNALEISVFVYDGSEHEVAGGPQSLHLRVFRDGVQVLDRTATPTYEVHEQQGAPECGRCETATLSFAME